MLKLSQKKRKALLALAVAATVLGANNALFQWFSMWEV